MLLQYCTASQQERKLTFHALTLPSFPRKENIPIVFVFVIRVSGIVVTARIQYSAWDVCCGENMLLELFLDETK